MEKIQPQLRLGVWVDKSKAKERQRLVEKTRAALGNGYSRTPTYSSYRAMLKRCYQPKCNGYHNYGGRGITVCDQWRQSYLAFFNDVGERPKGTVLDRINTNGNYEPGNCKWSTRVDSIRNKRGAIENIPGESKTERHKRTDERWIANNRQRYLKRQRDYYYSHKSH